MYAPLNIERDVTVNGKTVKERASGARVVSDWLGQTVKPGPDGVEVITPNEAMKTGNLDIPERLRQWLLDLRLLRHVPLCYLVPDARLLPPESIRFFHVDQTWTDRVIDGVFAAANIGTVDSVFRYFMLEILRHMLNREVAALASGLSADDVKPYEGPLTGMLMRSEAVSRWPDMIVRAFADTKRATAKRPLPESEEVAVLRAEPISRDIYIAIFAGDPVRVEVREPHVGVRYGVEPTNPLKPELGYRVNLRTPGGEQVSDRYVKIKLEDKTRVLDVENLLAGIKAKPTPTEESPWKNGIKNNPGQGSNVPDSAARAVAIHLEQRPYVQVFQRKVDEERGSLSVREVRAAGKPAVLSLRGGRQMKLDKFAARVGHSLEQEER